MLALLDLGQDPRFFALLLEPLEGTFKRFVFLDSNSGHKLSFKQLLGIQIRNVYKRTVFQSTAFKKLLSKTDLPY